VFEQIDPNRHIRSLRQRDGIAQLGLAVATLAVLALAWSDPMAVCVLPALVLPVLLAVRRYPGERILAVLARTRPRSRQRPRSSVPLAARHEVCFARGGLLLACALAVRPPPRCALAAS